MHEFIIGPHPTGRWIDIVAGSASLAEAVHSHNMEIAAAVFFEEPMDLQRNPSHGSSFF
ncbi:MAG: hypothetical protein JSS39_10600 [Nitrospira sp.]|nr:hypothetical protein [Nitrospira sp.]